MCSGLPSTRKRDKDAQLVEYPQGERNQSSRPNRISEILDVRFLEDDIFRGSLTVVDNKPKRCINPFSLGRCRKRYWCSRRVRRAHHSKQRITSPERCARRTLHCFLQHPPPKKYCFRSSPGVNSRITGGQHVTPDIQAHFCVHAEILCNSKVNFFAYFASLCLCVEYGVHRRIPVINRDPSTRR